MNRGKYVFSQVTSLIHREEFRRCVDRYDGDKRIRTFTCYQQFLCLLFGQFLQRESLRDIVGCLSAHQPKLYRLGLRNLVSRSTLADANERRDWRIYRDYAQRLITKARLLSSGLAEDSDLDIDNMVYAFDASTIDLCLSVYRWAKFRRTKSGIKLHTLIDVRREVPCFLHITPAAVHDVRALDELVYEPGAFYVLDRGYVDYYRLFRLHKASAYFVIRAKKNLLFRRLYSRKVDKSTGLICDQTIVMVGPKTSKQYSEKLRRIKFKDAETGKTYVYLTNHMEIEPMQVVYLYISRWKVELFFKWIKQHLRVKTFWGESENAVQTQIWVAVCSYLLIAILREKLKIKHSMYEMLQILSISAFDKVPVNQLFMGSRANDVDEIAHNQLTIF